TKTVRPKVCSKHFKPSDLRTTITGRRVLVENAIPSDFKWTTPLKTRAPPKDRDSVTADSASAAGSSYEISDGGPEDVAMVVDAENLDEADWIEGETDCVPTPTLNGHDYLYSGPETSAEEMLEAAQRRIRELEAALEKTSPYVWLQMQPDKIVRCYTGFPSFRALVSTFCVLRPTAENMYSWSQMQRLHNKGTVDVDRLRSTLRACKLSLFDQFYLCLQKLRIGTLN
ncbi:hypothetical protein QZH41_009149, partial [Actinostola sp. cb2023]